MAPPGAVFCRGSCVGRRSRTTGAQNGFPGLLKTKLMPFTLAEAQQLAANYNVIPLVRTLLADLETPVAAYLNLAQRPSAEYSYLLESVEGGENIGRYSYLGVNPYLILRQRQGKIEAKRGKDWSRAEGGLVELARAEVNRRRIAPLPGAPPFLAGAVGYFGWDMVRTLERLPGLAKDDLHFDDGLLMFFSRQVIFDHVKRQMVLVACIMLDEGAGRKQVAEQYRLALADLEKMERRLRRAPKVPASPVEKGPLKLKANMDQKRFLEMVRKGKEYIRAGDAFQIVLSLRMQARTRVAPFQAYRALRTVNPSPYMFFLKLGDFHMVGASPEKLVGVNGRQITYRPIAGTCPRGANEDDDRRLAEALMQDEKERAEHIMLVDLGRNDVGRVAETGTVSVPKLMFVERYSHVQHLVSTVEGQLAQDTDMFDALNSCFPAGTLSGAPKVRAMQIIDELEPTRRGVYGGSVMYLDFAGNLNACIAIRTMAMQKGTVYLQAGAGIVADSVPEKEYQEAMNKAGAQKRALELARAGL